MPCSTNKTKKTAERVCVPSNISSGPFKHQDVKWSKGFDSQQMPESRESASNRREKDREPRLVPLLSSSSFSSHGESSQKQQGVELVAFTDQQKLPGRMQGG